MKKFALGAMLVFAMASTSDAGSNANGIGYFALEVPAGHTINVDGDLSDCPPEVGLLVTGLVGG